MKHNMSHLSVNGQGAFMKIKDVIYDPPQLEVKPYMSKQPVLETKIGNIVDGAVAAHLNNKLESVEQNIYSIFDALFSQIEI
jgi:hypothetical protein